MVVRKKLGRLRRWRGFTAIELTAVASIIALLALILLPIVRKRVAQTRITAASDDMRTIEVAETFAHADTGHYFRLIDLDNGPYDSTKGDDGEVPRAYWNEPVPDVNFQALRDTWGGPYTQFNNTKFVFVGDLINARPELFRGLPTAPAPLADDGPILIINFPQPQPTGGHQGNDFSGTLTTRAQERSRYPVDPWGSPYIFFGDGPIGASGGTIAVTPPESNFSVATVYSLGPDGLPGDGALTAANAANSAFYFREAGVLGNGDDLVRRF